MLYATFPLSDHAFDIVIDLIMVSLSVTRVVIGIQVFFAGVALPKKYLKTEVHLSLPLIFSLTMPLKQTIWPLLIFF